MKNKNSLKKVDIKGKDKRSSIVTVRDQYPTYACFPTHLVLSTLIKKESQIFLMYKEIQNGAVGKSYMTNDLLIYGEIFVHFHHIIRKPFLIHIWLCNLSNLYFLFYEENFFFVSAAVSSKSFSRKSRGNRFCFLWFISGEKGLPCVMEKDGGQSRPNASDGCNPIRTSQSLPNNNYSWFRIKIINIYNRAEASKKQQNTT